MAAAERAAAAVAAGLMASLPATPREAARAAAVMVAAPVVTWLLLVLLRFVACALSPGHKARPVGLSCLYVGRVWHARFLPTLHKFGYGLFYTYLDLDHVEGAFRGMWPLAAHSRLALGADGQPQRAPPSSKLALAHFWEGDHLKDVSVETDPGTGQPLPLAERVRRLVARATGKRPEGRVCLLTHLRYCGYVFNPVSFYYVWDAEGRAVETVVAEVSNTPWNEMHCYVLSPRSKGVQAKAVTKEGAAVWNFVFAKGFHVSPFMEMDHVYDWDFKHPDETMWVVTHMLKKGKERYFTARFDLQRRPFAFPAFLGCVLRFPLITWAVQFLIHYQALKLWIKKVPFYSHPDGTETAASRLVAALAAPLWKLQALSSSASASASTSRSKAAAGKAA